MKKTYRIEVDCANCANKMERAVLKTPGVRNAAVSFMALTLTIEYEEGADEKTVLKNVKKNCKRIEDDIEIYE